MQCIIIFDNCKSAMIKRGNKNILSRSKILALVLNASLHGHTCPTHQALDGECIK